MSINFPEVLNSTELLFDPVRKTSRWFNAVGLIALFFMICLTFTDVVLRYIFHRPIVGVKEFTEVLLVIVVAATIGYTHDQKGHVKVEIITNSLPKKIKLSLEIITQFISVILFFIIIWRNIEQVLYFFRTNNQHGTAIFIPSMPFQIVLSLGCIILWLLLIRDLLLNIKSGLELKFDTKYWTFTFVFIILFLILSGVWIGTQFFDFNLIAIGVLGIVCMLVFMFIGSPISFTLILTGLLMIGHIRGMNTAFNMLSSDMFATSSNYLWSVACFFVVMGYLCLYAGFGDDIYVTFSKWFGQMRGGLAIATIGASTALAGIVGDALSITTTMGTIALPQMRKYNYDDRLSTGTIGAGATLGPLIPPSMGFIIYGILTGQSIGKLFIAGIIPGLILATCFIMVIFIQCRLFPYMGPAGPNSNIKEKVYSLKFTWPVVILFLFVIGGIYAGIFTATEGGAVGCIGALLIGLVMRRFTWGKFINALISSGKILGMILLIIIGATIFSRFIAWCNLADNLSNFLCNLHLTPKSLVALILLLFFLLGFFIDILPMLLIGVPIVHPIVVSVGVDPTWFTVLLVLIIQSGVITPPFATILFALKGLYPDVSLQTIFRGILPFCLATVVCAGLIFFIPSLVTWLPGLLYK